MCNVSDLQNQHLRNYTILAIIGSDITEKGITILKSYHLTRT